MEIWSWCLADKAAPREIKDALRLAALRTFSPGGAFEQDDAENWQHCTQSSSGRIARQYPLNLQMGLRHERYNEDVKGLASDYIISERTQRGFYDYWAQLLAAANWREVPSPYFNRIGTSPS